MKKRFFVLALVATLMIASVMGCAQKKTEGGDTVDNSKTESYQFKASTVVQKEDLLYCYDAPGYRFGITKSNTEVIALKNGDQIIGDILKGAGKYNLYSNNGLELCSAKKINSYKESLVKNHPALTVQYEADTMLENQGQIKTLYIFYNDHIEIETTVSYSNSDFDISAGLSKYKFDFINEPSGFFHKNAEKWIYPSDNDFPYPTLDGYINAYEYGDYISYVIVRETGNNKGIKKETYPRGYIPIFFDQAKGVKHTVKYDLLFAKKSDKFSIDKETMFRANNSPFAVDIVPVTKNEDNSTVFETDAIEFNIKLKNILGRNVATSIKYDVRNYYNEVVYKDAFVNSTLFAYDISERKITIKPDKKGMFWLNLTVYAEGYSYKQCYPFAIITPHEFKNNATSPFSITAIHSDPNPIYPITLASRLGVANTRFGISGYFDENFRKSQLEAADLFKKFEISLNGMNLYWVPPTDAKSYSDELEKNYTEYGHLLESIEVGNENNMIYTPGSGEGFDSYVDNVFMPAYNIVKKKHNGKLILAALAGPDTKWMDLLYERGLWDKFDVISFHPYGFPYSPDGESANYWHVENALKTFYAKMQQYGEKEVYITETGAPTNPGVKALVDLRTSADYMIRTYMIALPYGPSRIQWYCFFDRGYGSTFDTTDNEYNFGAFYNPNVNDEIMPKPSGIAFANMSRILDGYKSSVEIKGVSSTVRAFDVTCDSGQVMVAWSTRYPMENDVQVAAANRKPSLPWVDKWDGNETIEVASNNAKVIVTDIMGNSISLEVENGKAKVPLTGSPVYIKR